MSVVLLGERTSRRARWPLMLVLCSSSAACGDPEVGALELAWEFVDRDGDKIYPGGLFEPAASDACDLPARLGDETVTYDLGVQLEICDSACESGCGDPDCLVVAPLRFGCKTFRGSSPDIPASDDPYLLTLRPVVDIDQTGQTCLEPAPTCIAVPGPRQRKVDPGLVTDLQVYQIAVGVDIDVPANREGGALDLEACGCA